MEIYFDVSKNILGLEVSLNRIRFRDTEDITGASSLSQMGLFLKKTNQKNNSQNLQDCIFMTSNWKRRRRLCLCLSTEQISGEILIGLLESHVRPRTYYCLVARIVWPITVAEHLHWHVHWDHMGWERADVPEEDCLANRQMCVWHR